jgi:hypothetical protein
VNRGVVGLAVGMTLGFAGWFGGFRAFLLVAALGAVGWVVGRLLDGGIDVRELLGPRDGRHGDVGSERLP